MKTLIQKAICHITTVLNHKKIVFKLSLKAGIPIRGLLHDLSKFSCVELFESIKYYEDGKESPLLKCIKEKGYSNAWHHHSKHNKHHLEYWIVPDIKYGAMLIPYKYWVELICDNLAAGINYHKDDWNKEYQLNYWTTKLPNWKSKKGFAIHPAIEKSILEVFTQVSILGIDPALNKKNLQEIYNKNAKEFL